jgi:RimJ/RimL family protein N-acetyltransferase
MKAIETDRLVIRNFVAGDWRDLKEIATKYQASEYAQYDHQWPTTEDEIKEVTEWFAGGDSYLAVSLKATGKVIGFMCLNHKDKEAEQVFGLGYVFNVDYYGQGYATEGGRAMLKRAFDSLGADKVTAGTAAANGPSCRLLERLGFKEKGRATGSFWKTEDGKPIEFETVSLELSRDRWLVQS